MRRPVQNKPSMGGGGGGADMNLLKLHISCIQQQQQQQLYYSINISILGVTSKLKVNNKK